MDIPRKDMPVISSKNNSKQVLMFKSAIENGELDIKKPFAKGKPYYPTNLKKDASGEQWLMLGTMDGDSEDDKVKVRIKDVPVHKLKPTQSQIWINVIADNIKEYGLSVDNSKALVTMSSDGYILDGHHRYGRQMMTNPKSTLRGLIIPIDIKQLTMFARSFGNAIGNTQNN